MAKLAAAPLQYVLTLVRFPKVSLSEDQVSTFHENVRNDYPLRSDQMQQGLGMTVGPTGLQLGTTADKLVQFSKADLTAGLILSPEFLLLHTAQAYEGHEKFFSDFLHAVTCLLAVTDIPIKVATALGCRYVDLVVPRPHETLREYLEPWALPTEVPIDASAGLELTEGFYIAAFKTNQGALRFQALRHPSVTLSPDLNTPFVQMNHWVAERPEGDFALLDIDHGSAFPRPMPLDVSYLEQKLYALHGPVRSMFNAAATDHARKVWGEA